MLSHIYGGPAKIICTLVALVLIVVIAQAQANRNHQRNNVVPAPASLLLGLLGLPGLFLLRRRKEAVQAA